MDLFTVSVSLLACLAAFLLGTVWVGISLFMVGLVAFYFFTGSPTLAILSNIMWNSISGSTMWAKFCSAARFRKTYSMGCRHGWIICLDGWCM